MTTRRHYNVKGVENIATYLSNQYSVLSRGGAEINFSEYCLSWPRVGEKMSSKYATFQNKQ